MSSKLWYLVIIDLEFNIVNKIKIILSYCGYFNDMGFCFVCFYLVNL